MSIKKIEAELEKYSKLASKEKFGPSMDPGRDSRLSYNQHMVDTLSYKLQKKRESMDRAKAKKKEPQQNLPFPGGLPRRKKKLTESFIIAILEKNYTLAEQLFNDAIETVAERAIMEKKKEIAQRLDEVSKKKAFAAYAWSNDPDADDEKNVQRGNRLARHIRRKWGEGALYNADAHTAATHYGRYKGHWQSKLSKSKDPLTDPVLAPLSKNVKSLKKSAKEKLAALRAQRERYLPEEYEKEKAGDVLPSKEVKKMKKDKPRILKALKDYAEKAAEHEVKEHEKSKLHEGYLVTGHHEKNGVTQSWVYPSVSSAKKDLEKHGWKVISIIPSNKKTTKKKKLKEGYYKERDIERQEKKYAEKAAEHEVKEHEKSKLHEGKWNYPKSLTKTVETSDMGTTNAADNRKRRKEWRKKIKAEKSKKLNEGKLKNWSIEFEEKHGRKPTNDDLSPFKPDDPNAEHHTSKQLARRAKKAMIRKLRGKK